MTDDGEEDVRLVGVVIVLVLGAGLLGVGYYMQSQWDSVDDAEPVEATIIESSYGENTGESDRDRTFPIRVTYEYEVDGETYRSSNFNAGPSRYAPEKETRAQAIVDQHSEGSTVEAYVDPDDPESAYIREPRRGEQGSSTIVSYVLMGIGGLILLGGLKSSVTWLTQDP